MKLLLCAKCNQIFNLTREYQECLGGHGGGQYADEINAKVWGDPNRIFVLGFANSTLVNALKTQIQLGDSSETFEYAGRITPKAREFTAFIIPNAADSVIRVPERFIPIIR